MKRFVAILTMCLAFLTGSGDTLWWTVDENATIDGVDGSSLYSFLDSKSYGGEDDIWYGAKVVVKDNSGAKIGTLDLYY